MMVRGSSLFIIKVVFMSAFCLYSIISRSLDFLFLDVLGSPRADIEFFVVVV